MLIVNSADIPTIQNPYCKSLRVPAVFNKFFVFIATTKTKKQRQTTKTTTESPFHEHHNLQIS